MTTLLKNLKNHLYKFEINKNSFSNELFISFLFIILVLISIFTFQPTLSSYGLVIESMTGKNTGLLFGSPTPIRSDEYSVLTPLIQMVVNSNFNVNNLKSIYNETFLAPYTLPFIDEALIFKPQFLGFLISPSIGLSFYHFFYVTLFLLGWYFFSVKVLNFKKLVGLIFTLTLFFSPFVQYIFTTHGQSLSFFPWILILIFSKNDFNIKKSLFIIYTSACTIISDFYPPYFIQYIIFFIILFLYKFREISIDKQHITKFIYNSCFSLIGCLLAFYVLYDLIHLLMKMPYASNANFMAGTENFYRKLGEFFPPLIYNGKTSLIGLNAVEIGTIGGLWFFLSIFLIFRKNGSLKYIFTLWPFIIFYILISCWQHLSIPEEIGIYSGLSKLSPSRSYLISGLLLLIISFKLLNFTIIKNTKFLYGLAILCFLSLLTIKFFQFGFYSLKYDLIIITFIALSSALLLIIKQNDFKNFIIISMITLFSIFPGLIVNPIQMAKPIFDLQNDKFTKKFDKWTKFENVNIDTIYMGGILSGLGFKSASHVIPLPDINKLKKTFKKYYYLSDSDFKQKFSRWLHLKINLNQNEQSKVFFEDAVTLSPNLFIKNGSNQIRKYMFQKLKVDITSKNKQNKFAINFLRENRHYCVEGWALFNEFDFENPNIYVDTDSGSQIVYNKIFQRWDVARLFDLKQGMFSGFKFCYKNNFNNILLKHKNQLISFKKNS